MLNEFQTKWQCLIVHVNTSINSFYGNHRDFDVLFSSRFYVSQIMAIVIWVSSITVINFYKIFVTEFLALPCKSILGTIIELKLHMNFMLCCLILHFIKIELITKKAIDRLEKNYNHIWMMVQKNCTTITSKAHLYFFRQAKHLHIKNLSHIKHSNDC